MSASKDKESFIFKNIEKMQAVSQGMDVIIISTNSQPEHHFWQKRLDDMRGQVIKETAHIFLVYEDWDQGAGNALGTFYAFEEAQRQAKARFHIDLLDELIKGTSIALYHTAGRGTRLAPLPGSEQNSKSKVKLPGLLRGRTEMLPITLLEAIIKQTAIFAPVVKSRLSVFWGDQLFIPHDLCNHIPKHHIEILTQVIEQPTEQYWQDKHLNRYGLIAMDDQGHAKQLEKVDYQTLQSLRSSDVISSDAKIGLSLGSFSLSHEILQAFLKEFSQELCEKNKKMDTDTDLWMPLTLTKEAYSMIMSQKGNRDTSIHTHFERISQFKTRFIQKNSGNLALFGAFDVGMNSYWWDYGEIRAFYNNCLLLTENNPEGSALRAFFTLPKTQQNIIDTEELEIDEHSRLINCSIRKGRIKNSVLIGVTANSMQVEDAVIINTCANHISAQNSLLYNVIEESEINLTSGMVRADIFQPDGDGHVKVHHDQQHAASTGWSECLKNNTHSFEEIYHLNQKENPEKVARLTQILQNRVKGIVLNTNIDKNLI